MNQKISQNKNIKPLNHTATKGEKKRKNQSIDSRIELKRKEK